MTDESERLARVEAEAKHAHRRLDMINGQIAELRAEIASARTDLADHNQQLRDELAQVRELLAGLVARSRFYATVGVIMGVAAVGSFVTVVLRSALLGS